MRKASIFKNSGTPVLKKCKENSIQCQVRKVFRAHTSEIGISADIFKFTPVYWFIYNRDVVKYLLEPKDGEGWRDFRETQYDMNDNSDPDPFAKE